MCLDLKALEDSVNVDDYSDDDDEVEESGSEYTPSQSMFIIIFSYTFYQVSVFLGSLKDIEANSGVKSYDAADTEIEDESLQTSTNTMASAQGRLFFCSNMYTKIWIFFSRPQVCVSQALWYPNLTKKQS